MAFKIKFQGSDSGKSSDASGGSGGKAIATFFFGMFFLFGLFFTAFVVADFKKFAETYFWDEERCIVTSSQVKRTGGESPYQASVDFRRADGGFLGANRHLRLDDPSDSSWDKARRRIGGFPVDAIVPCYVSDTGGAVLVRGPLWIGFFILLTGVFLAIGGGGLYMTWRPERRDAFGMPLPEAMAPTGGQGRKGGRGVQWFALLFMAAGLVVGWFLAVKPISLLLEAQSWDPGTCTVEHSSVVSHQSDDGTTYSVDILYRWDRGRGPERSSRYTFWGGSSSGSAAKQAIVRRYPAGDEVDCWIHPEKLHEAVLNRELTGHAALALIPLVFFGVGLAIFVYGRRRARKVENLRMGAQMGALPFPGDDPLLETLPLFDPSLGAGPLKASSSRWGRVVGVTFAALFWNGIVSVFLYQAWQSWQRGQTEYGLLLFMTPFVLVGIALVGGIGWSLLSLFNARPIVEMNRNFVELGEDIELRWRFEGNVSSIENLKLVLKGEERATYQVGTNSHTQTEDFYVAELLNLTGAQCATGGQISAPIPPDSMHSFESSDNAIVWRLEVRGEVRRWPDVSEDYPLVVLPRASAHKSGRSEWS